MGKARKPLERRLDTIEAKLTRIPAPPDPQEQAETQRRWERVLQAYVRGDREPPDSDSLTTAYWRTVTRYAPMLESLYQQGVLKAKTSNSKR